MACPLCGCRCGGLVPPAEPREKRVKLTPEERVQKRRDTQHRYYEKTKDERREKHKDENKRWYLSKHDSIIERRREKRRLAREANEISRAEALEIPGPAPDTPTPSDEYPALSAA